MSRAPKRRCYERWEDFDSDSEDEELSGAQASEATEEESSSTSKASSSLPSSPSSALGEGFPIVDTLSPSQSSVSPSGSSPDPASMPLCQSVSQAVVGSCATQGLIFMEPLPADMIDDRISALVRFLLLKYRTRELATQAEMLSRVTRECREQFDEIFSETCECLQVVFGVDVREVDPINHIYVMVSTLGLSYDGVGINGRSFPKTGFLIFILSIIFIEGNCVPEERVWEKLGGVGLDVGIEHSIYGEPRELLTRILVQQLYIVYRRVADSDPARYEFLWGPRAHAETSKMKVLEYLAKINESEPSAFPVLYQDALRDQAVRAQAEIALNMTRASSSVMSRAFSRSE